jgi:hypothetical protein
MRSGPARLPDAILLDILRSPNPLQNAHFVDVHRTLSENRPLGACIELFTPFGLEPCIVGNHNPGIQFATKYLWEHEGNGRPVLWLEKVDQILGLDANWCEGLQATVLERRRKLKSSVIVCGLGDSADIYDGGGSSNLETVFLRAELRELLEPWETDLTVDCSRDEIEKKWFSRSLVYDLTSPEDIHALVSTVLQVRDGEKERNENEVGCQEEEAGIWVESLQPAESSRMRQATPTEGQGELPRPDILASKEEDKEYRVLAETSSRRNKLLMLDSGKRVWWGRE